MFSPIAAGMFLTSVVTGVGCKFLRYNNIRPLSSFGSADFIRPTLRSMDRKPHVCVVGAGVIGLTVALRILRMYGKENIDITVIADRIGTGTTSHGCGGVWEPYQLGSTPQADVNRWAKCSYDHFVRMSRGPDAAVSGCQLVTGYTFDRVPITEPPPWMHLAMSFRMLTSDEVRDWQLPPEYVSGYSHLTTVADQKYYLPYMEKQLREAGVGFVSRRLDSLDELVGGGNSSGSGSVGVSTAAAEAAPSFDVLVNCTGIAADDLLNNASSSGNGSGSGSGSGSERCYPVRGQVLRLRAPWLKHFINFECSHYLIPQTDCVVAGGTAQVNDWSEEVRPADTEAIMGHLGDVIPALKQAEVVSYSL